MFTKVARTLAYVAVVVIAIGGLALENRVHRATHGALPPLFGRTELAGLDRPVNVFRDEWGAPHIHAKTDADAFFALGYVSAQERMFQMDLMRRISTGRLSEVVGPAGLEIDKEARIIGFGRIAEGAEPNLAPESRLLAEAYVAGVNAYLAEGVLPVEFQVMGYAPEPWTVRDSLAIGKYQGWRLSMNMRSELARMAVIAERGADVADLLLPGLESWGPYILNPEQRDYTGTRPTVGVAPPEPLAMTPALRDTALALLAQTGASPIGPRLPLASNNWVVAGSKTASGKPLLANDPHLALPMPGVWMEARIKSPGFDVTGVLFPGLPIIALGHNRYIAWGATTTAADTQDLYIETPHPPDPRQLYLVPGGVKRYLFQRERILVKGGSPDGSVRYVDLDVRMSRHGPIINDLLDGLPADAPPLALRWAGQEPTDDLAAFLAMNRARNWKEFKAGVDQIGAPIQNWVFAAIDGDIGYICGGLIPVRAPGHDPRAPVPGATDDYEWVGWIPRDELPQVVNPPAGYIASANNKVVPPAYPYHIQDVAVTPYRAARAQELLEGRHGLTMEDMARMQMDDYMIAGRRIAPHIVRAVRAAGTDTPAEVAALAALESWDFHAAVDSVGCTVFHFALEALYPAVLEDEVSPELFEQMNGMFARLSGVGLLDRMCNEGFAASLWDNRQTEARETPDVVLAAAFKTGVAELVAQHGRRPGRWQWGDAHRQQFSHVFAEVPFAGSVTQRNAEAGLGKRVRFAVVDHYFSAGPIPLAGGGSSLRASPSVYFGGMFDAVWGVSFRHIVDLADVSAAASVISTGNSGHAASPFYRDQVALWATGRYHPMILDFPEGTKTPNETLLLLPAGTGGQS